jgi:hypothetical protein
LVHLVLTHGRAQEFGIPQTMLEAWEPALRYGLQRAEAPFFADIPISLAYYGDYWRPDAEDVPTRGGEEEVAPSELQSALAAEIAAAAPGGAATTRAGWDSLNSLIVWLDERVSIGDVAVGMFMQDVESYFNDAALRDKAIQRIVDAVNETSDEVILLGHSLGTVVAYDALRRHPDLPVRAYVSLGSPLGLPMVRRSLEAGGPLRFPDDLDSWVNVYDKRDFVTGNQPLAQLYPADDGRQVDDKLSKGRRPSLLKPNSAHDGIVYLSAVVLGKAVRSLVETIQGEHDAGREGPIGRTRGVGAGQTRSFEAMLEPTRGELLEAVGDLPAGELVERATRSARRATANGGEAPPEPAARPMRGDVVRFDDAGDEAAPAAEVAEPAAQTRKVQRAASAEFPETVMSGSVNTLRYQVGARPEFADAVRVNFEVPVDAEWLDLTVRVQAPDFDVLDPETNKPADSAPLSLNLTNPDASVSGEFLLKAKEIEEPLRSTIVVRFFHGNADIGRIKLFTTVDDGARDVARDQPAAATEGFFQVFPNAAPEPDLAIFVTSNGRDQFLLEALWMGDHAPPVLRQEPEDLGVMNVGADAREWAKGILLEFQETLTPKLTQRERKERVENLGRELWNQLPDEFQDFYWRKMHGKDLTVVISSEEPYIPWELVKPVRKGSRTSAPMLGAAFPMARWLDDFGKLPSPIAVHEFRVVAPGYTGRQALPAADQEANDLVARFKATRVKPGKKRQVLDLLRSKNLQILHFSGHGKFGDGPDDSNLALLDDALELIDLNSADFADPDDPHDPPLIFLNACEVGDQGWALTHIGGWAAKFCGAGGAAFVGPYWEVSDEVAHKAALLFYGLLQEGKPIGEAMRQVRLRFQEDDTFRYDPTWLAYTLHCQPNVTVTFPELH